MHDSDWKLLLTLSETMSINQAAKKLFVSQPALSKNIERIEREAGSPVILRTNRGIRFTDTGIYMVEQAKKICALIDETSAHLKEMETGREFLSIGTAPSYARYSLPHLLLNYNETRKEHPLRFQVSVMNSSDVLNEVEKGNLQVGFVNGERNWRYKVLVAIGYGYIVSKKPIRLEDLPSLPLISHYTDAASLRRINNWWRENFQTPFRITYTVADFATCFKWVQDGLGYGILYNPSQENADNFYRIPMVNRDGSPLTRTTWAVYHPDQISNCYVSDFIRYAHRKFQEENSPLTP
jgi:DNA-binding transcriptional LysR family regulator